MLRTELDFHQRNGKDVVRYVCKKNVTSLVLYYKKLVLILVCLKNIAKIIISVFKYSCCLEYLNLKFQYCNDELQ